MTKTISLADDAYEALVAVRHPGESFSELARRLARSDAERALFDPAIKISLSERDADEWKQDIRSERQRSKEPRVKLE